MLSNYSKLNYMFLTRDTGLRDTGQVYLTRVSCLAVSRLICKLILIIYLLIDDSTIVNTRYYLRSNPIKSPSNTDKACVLGDP